MRGAHVSVKRQIERFAPEPQQPEIDGFRAQHLVLGEREVTTEAGRTKVVVMPRTTSNWSNPVPSDRRSGGHHASFLPDTVIAARQRVHHALDAVGPEFSGLLVDVCCFLKRLDVAERERRWPARSAKIVLQLALECLARHYGYAAATSGHARSRVRTWLADDVAFSVVLKWLCDCSLSCGGLGTMALLV